MIFSLLARPTLLLRGKSSSPWQHSKYDEAEGDRRKTSQKPKKVDAMDVNWR
jgi:hypothetical protein